MKLIKNIPLLVLLAVVPFFYGSPGCSVVPSTPELFEQAWNDFDQNYSYFIYKNIDWNAVKEQYAPNFSQELDANEFAKQLNEMLQVLHDWHIWVQAPNGDVFGYNGSYSVNRPDTSVTDQYIQGLEELAKGVIYHGMVSNNIAYIEIDTLGTEEFKAVSDQAIEEMFAKYEDADGMIIDIRFNSGGNEENAAKIASRFIDESFMYGYTVNRNGPNHDDFDDPYEHTLEPSTGTHFTGPAVCLIGKKCMSSAEWFTLMMKHAPNVTLIGDTTRGASGFPRDFKLPNGVSYGVPRWIAYTYEDEVIEDNGVAPDIEIPVEQSFDDTHDYVLERAIAFLEGGETVTTTVPESGTTTSMPGGATTSSMPGGAITTTVPGQGTTTTADMLSSTTTTASGSGGPSLTVSPASGQALVTEFTFTAQAGDLAGSVVEYWWDFDGDGYSLGWAYGVGLDLPPAETNTATGIKYWFPGTYTAYVIMWDDYDNFEIASTTVQVTE